MTERPDLDAILSDAEACEALRVPVRKPDLLAVLAWAFLLEAEVRRMALHPSELPAPLRPPGAPPDEAGKHVSSKPEKRKRIKALSGETGGGDERVEKHRHRATRRPYAHSGR